MCHWKCRASNPGCYSKINSTVSTLNPGDYVVTGTLNIGNLSSNPAPGGAGSGVFIYLQGSSARLQAGNNQDIHLKARTTSTAGWADPTGSVYRHRDWQERGNINNFTVGQNFTIHINGAVYMPSVDVDFQNSVDFQSTGCSLFIAKSLSIETGSGNLGNNGCAATFGGAAFLSRGCCRMNGAVTRSGVARSERGAALVEMAVALPVLVVILFGTTDFARVMFTAIEVTNAARAGAQYGAMSLSNSKDTSGIQSTATNGAPNVPGITAAGTSTCLCAQNDGSGRHGPPCPAMSLLHRVFGRFPSNCQCHGDGHGSFQSGCSISRILACVDHQPRGDHARD